MNNRLEAIKRYTLGVLLLVVAINAFGGGYYGMSGAPNVPVEWLEGSPFKSYFIPALVLFVVVGGSCLVASVGMFAKRSWARKAAFASCLVIFTWLGVQVSIIGYVSWMQPATAIAAVVILLLALVYKPSAARAVQH